MQRVTRDDVARRAGTSPAVVSYVLNNGPRPVAAATRARVQTAMAELGYRPNLVARALRSARSHTIGLVVPDSTEPFFTELVHAVERAAYAEGMLLLLGNSGFSRAQENRYATTLAGMRVDGLLLVRAEVSGAEPEPAGFDVPVVYLNHRAPRGVDATSVLLANRRGARLATEHLIGHGHRRIGCLTGDARTGPVADRAHGWASALRRAGLDASMVLRTGLTRSDTRDRVRDWLGSPGRPEAIMATADGLALDVLSVAQELGLRVPEELAVMGFGATAPSAHSWPPLSTAGLPFDDIGTAAVATLNAVRRTGRRQRDRVLDVRRVPRRSCGCR
ncbi:LacI family DNA-binding transcriptional regulator [Pseudonocardia acaciae]|uniref:LacI family DNA-binding transcriptional regulator n=1 Tax=Pseudonocardia acaciae TaxID=551276 RepID=UPI00048FA6DD|nr:LacI family DNA-binding transcriptional regulator [Pseudonocardia acaciae]